ncbi:type III secretion system effector XopF1 [Xanthomonas fragariae]|uniref:type III secretion system effector XopF1 n=2 Tax=Xanthomonas fragariae TaxID=48664 RepID=UPI0031B57CC4
MKSPAQIGSSWRTPQQCVPQGDSEQTNQGEVMEETSTSTQSELLNGLRHPSRRMSFKNSDASKLASEGTLSFTESGRSSDASGFSFQYVPSRSEFLPASDASELMFETGSRNFGSFGASEASELSFRSAHTDFMPPDLQMSITPDMSEPQVSEPLANSSAQALETLKNTLRSHLRGIRFEEESTTQRDLENQYLQWADARLQERVAAFGPDAGYQIGGDMAAIGAKATLPIAYECLRKLMIVTTRQPLGVFTGTTYDKHRIPGSEPVSMAAVAALGSSAGSYVCDTFLVPAMDRRARVANLPRFKAIDPKVLVPDPPPVALEISTHGKKRFSVRGGRDLATAQEKADVYESRKRISEWQAVLEERSVRTFLFKPGVNAVVNGARRIPSGPAHTPIGQTAMAALAIGSWGIAHQAILETGKALACTGQASVPDLVGGHQRLNTFLLSLPDTARPPTQWSDAIHFPRYLLETGKEGMALAKHAWNTAGAVTDAVNDVLFRHVSANMLATFASTSVGRFIASLWRGGRYTAPPNEAVNAPAVLFGQGAATATNDMVWNAVKSKNGSYTANATRLDQARAVEAARHDLTITETTRALVDSIRSVYEALDPARAMEEGSPSRQRLQPSHLQALFRVLEQLNLEIDMQDVPLEKVDAAYNLWREEKDFFNSCIPSKNSSESIADAAAVTTLVDQLGTLQQAISQRQQLKRWEQGRS